MIKPKMLKKTLKKNLKTALDETRDLESSYRTVALFFRNTDLPAVKNVSIVNAELDQLSDLDNTRFFDHIRDEILAKYDRLDLRENYSLMVVPGYLGSKAVVDNMGKISA